MEETNGGGFRVSNREVYDSLRALERQVGEMSNRMTTILEENGGLRKRVGSLENKFYGVVAGLVTAIGLLTATLVTGAFR